MHICRAIALYVLQPVHGEILLHVRSNSKCKTVNGVGRLHIIRSGVLFLDPFYPVMEVRVSHAHDAGLRTHPNFSRQKLANVVWRQ